jgi:hypothetical protein
VSASDDFYTTYRLKDTQHQSILSILGFGAIMFPLSGSEAILTNRVHIDAPAGVIDIEGEKDFVEGLLAKLFPLIEEAGFGSRPQGAEAEASGEVDTVEDVTVVENGKGKPRTRKVSKKAPAGHSCADRVLALKTDGYFKQKRSTADIVAKLSEKAQNHNVSQVSAAAGQLVKRGSLQRIKDGNNWLYFWDRD